LAAGDVGVALDLLDRHARYARGADTTLLHALLFVLDHADVLLEPLVDAHFVHGPLDSSAMLVELRIRGTGRDAGTPIDFQVAHLWWIGADGVVGFQWFHDVGVARDALRSR
jgi:hypothetical protein